MLDVLPAQDIASLPIRGGCGQRHASHGACGGAAQRRGERDRRTRSLGRPGARKPSPACNPDAGHRRGPRCPSGGPARGRRPQKRGAPCVEIVPTPQPCDQVVNAATNIIVPEPMIVIDENSNVDDYSAPAPVSVEEKEVDLLEEDAQAAAFSFVSGILRDAAADIDMERYAIEIEDDIFSVEDIEEHREDIDEDALEAVEQVQEPVQVSPLEAASQKLRKGLVDSGRSGALRAALETVQAQKQEEVLRNLRVKLQGSFVQSARMGTLEGALQVASMVSQAEPMSHPHFSLDDLDADLEEICRDANFDVTDSDIEGADDDMDDVLLSGKVFFMPAAPELIDTKEVFAEFFEKLPEPTMNAQTARGMFKTRYAFPRATKTFPAVPETTLKKPSAPTVFKAEISPYAFEAFERLADLLMADEQPQQQKTQQENPETVPVPPAPRAPADKAPPCRSRRPSARAQPAQPELTESKEIEIPAEVLASLEGSTAGPQSVVPQLPENIAAQLAAAALIWEAPKEPPKTAPCASTRAPLVSPWSSRPQAPQESFPTSFAAVAPQPPATAPPRSRPSAPVAPAAPPSEECSPRRRRRQHEPEVFRLDGNSDTEGAAGKDLESDFKALGAQMFNLAAQDQDSSLKLQRHILPPPAPTAGSPKRGRAVVGGSMLPDIARKTPTTASIECSKRMSSCAMAQSARNTYF